MNLDTENHTFVWFSKQDLILHLCVFASSLGLALCCCRRQEVGPPLLPPPYAPWTPFSFGAPLAPSPIGPVRCRHQPPSLPPSAPQMPSVMGLHRLLSLHWTLQRQKLRRQKLLGYVHEVSFVWTRWTDPPRPRAARALLLLNVLSCLFICYFADFLVVFVDETFDKTRFEYSSLQAINSKSQRCRNVWHKLDGCLDLASPLEWR